MELKLFKTLWGFTGSYQQAIEQTLAAGLHGIEGPMPDTAQQRAELKSLLKQNDLEYIGEITTAGSYVPNRSASLEEHLDSFTAKLIATLELNPLFINCIGGCDAWSEMQSLEFFSRAMGIAKQHAVTVSFETHRSRSMYNPWSTLRFIQVLPDIKLTCDFSHWCVVCERLIDTEHDIIETLANNAHHIHARVGYDQGPQVPHPAAPEYAACLRAHQSWWELIWQSQMHRDYAYTTMTPEFGPDGYLHLAPFTQLPVADLLAVNTWMANVERRHFNEFCLQPA